MSLAAQQSFAASNGTECTPFAHVPGCSCMAARAIMVEHGQGSPDLSFTSGTGPPMAATAGEAAGGWWQQCQSLSTYPSCQYGSLGSTDNLTLSTSASSEFSASPVPLVNGHQHSFAAPVNCRNRPQPPLLVETPQLRSSHSMSEFNAPAASHSAPAPHSPSSGNSSDTSSPRTPPPTKQEYGPHNNRDDGQHIGFPDLESVQTLRCDGEEVKPEINASIDRNIFFKEKRWTCYRRNYLFVQCSYSLSPCIPGAPIHVETKDGKRMVQALGVKLAAVMDEGKGKDVGLVQQTPKRDRGPQYAVKVEKLAPAQPGEAPMTYTPLGASTNSPYLPFQSDDSSKSASSPPTGTHTFERIQFKQATANNGRRRAQQQFYYLLVELHADVRHREDQPEEWIKVAHRISEPMVVRGRSPGHYKDSPTSSGSSQGGAGGGYSSSNFGYGSAGPGISYGLSSSSQVRGSVSGSSGGGGYFHTHTLPSTPGWMSGSSMSVKSPASMVESKSEPFMTEQEAYDYDNAEGYRWYPMAANNASLHAMSRNGLRYEQGMLSSESSGFATTGAALPGYAPTCSRFQSLETSHGYYPDVKAAF